MTQLTFFVVTPDSGLLKRWETTLTRQGWAVAAAADLGRFEAEAQRGRYGVALLDWETARAQTPAAIRKAKAAHPGLSFILVSDPSLSPDRVIESLEAGADDHFLRAIDDKLMLAKLKAHMRRLLPNLATALDVLKSPGGELKVDRSSFEAWSKGERGRLAPISGLTRTEFSMLALFLEEPGKVLERGYIMDRIGKGDGDIRPGTVDKHVESLRKKLGRHGGMLKTVYGVGYAFREE